MGSGLLAQAKRILPTCPPQLEFDRKTSLRHFAYGDGGGHDDTLEAEMDKIMSFPDLVGEFDGPTLFLTGALSDYVLPEHRAGIKALFPQARFAKLKDAGHWLHADKPREFEAALRSYLTA